MQWIMSYWAHVAMPKTNDYEVEVLDQENYTEYLDWESEWILTTNSIAMVNENYVDLGAYILLWPRIVNVPDRFLDQADPNMPALMDVPDDQPPMTQSEWLLHLR